MVGMRLMLPGLQIWVQCVMFKPPMVTKKDWAEQVREFGPMMNISNLLQFILKEVSMLPLFNISKCGDRW